MKALRVLLVDDEPSHLLTLAANLELEEMQITTAENAEEALTAMSRQKFDLVLSDVRMPGMNGVELFRELNRLYPEVPVILMTGFAFEALLDEALQAGAFAVLPKPFDIAQVLPLLRRAGLRPTALIVDTLQEEAAATAEALQSIGIRACAVFDEASTEQTLRDSEIDICVIALEMAVYGDPTLVQRLKQINPALGLIAVSGHDVPELMRRLGTSYPLAWLRKPVTLPRLAKAIAVARGSTVVQR